jgi:hypothetical protein
LNEATRALLVDISRRWCEHGWAECMGWGYEFARWPDGSDVTPEERDAVQRHWDALPPAVDPWSNGSTPSNSELVRLVREQCLRTPYGRFKQQVRRVLGVSPLRVIRGVRRALTGSG